MSTDNSTTRIEFRQIPQIEGYHFGSDGSVWSQWCKGYGREVLGEEWKQIQGWVHKSGHRNVRVKLNGAMITFGVHYLIAWAFHGPCPDGMECRHKNGIPFDNRQENLAWGTRKENIQDQFDHGCFAVGEKSGAAKMTEDKVREMRRLRAEGMTLRALAAKFNLNSNRTVQCIVTRKTWRHVP